MDSRLEISSQLGQGSRFSFQLELRPATPGKQKTVAPANPRHWRILVVEDHPLIRSVMRLMLEGAGHTVSCAETGREALQLFREETPEVVFLDLQLPDMDGLETARLIRELQADVPLVAVTAHAGDEYRVQCMQAGFAYFLTKPVEGDRLFRVLAELEGGLA